MLTTGSPVLITEEGRVRAVETLQIGEFVFDPFADTYCEIIDILVRRIDWSWDVSYPAHRLAPVRISRSTFGRDLPRIDVTVSPGQVIQSEQCIKKGSRYRKVRRLPAAALIGEDGVVKASTAGSVTYHALFTSSVQILNVAGLYLETLTPDLFRGSAPSRAVSAYNMT
ncbi:Hint domain-containing protein [Celeribacter marinus]|uniref:Hint domain-containing protein n=1 Tax=Celeribacter marinus TaxID=1397108 RepID=UPI003F6AE0AD